MQNYTENEARIYARTLSLILAKAVADIMPGCRLVVEHSLGNGQYCEIHGVKHISPSEIAQLKKHMTELVEANQPIIQEIIPRQQAIALFENIGKQETAHILRYRQVDKVSVYHLGNLIDYFYEPLFTSTGQANVFDLLPYPPGLILLYPKAGQPDKLPEFTDLPKLAAIFKEAEEWARILGIGYVSSLNDVIDKGDTSELILISEALHEKRTVDIADVISKNKTQIRLISIAGPSSSGKTSFASRLYIQLRVNGIKPLRISLDNYFLPREFTPVDENGQPDLESLEALDLGLFNDQLKALIEEDEVSLPVFNFKTGLRQYMPPIRLEPDQPIIIEGIHGLNERLTQAIHKDRKFKIYISALTQLNIDEHNRVPTTYARLLRRMIRDHQFRGADASRTLQIWPSVRAGEERNIFPYQEEADVMFNSSLAYEIPLLKRYVEPLLKEIGTDDPQYSRAVQLLDLLSHFIPVPADKEVNIPPNSLIREFTGHSCFFGKN
ncbi:uridine kinase family protein [Mahella australiensis]|uniref:Uridine kinase n=1 Tax=Mahella australiensis (strain DSM 15567 / CIP 107919 / 50-1 BON) TaxID=697281 RepID=F3ZWC0_MAHA5|nr:nucleoside kinase [Mahella australiensis]AEE97529.1 uridine kinase [Mahella australiensis 50-1 BON]